MNQLLLIIINDNNNSNHTTNTTTNSNHTTTTTTTISNNTTYTTTTTNNNNTNTNAKPRAARGSAPGPCRRACTRSPSRAGPVNHTSVVETVPNGSRRVRHHLRQFLTINLTFNGFHHYQTLIL